MGRGPGFGSVPSFLFNDGGSREMSEEITVSVVEVRKGSRLDFTIELDPPADSALTDASFQVARQWSDPDLLLDLSGAAVVPDFSDANVTRVTVSIGATALASITVPSEGIVCAALLTLGNPLDPESPTSFEIPFKIRPGI